jgi:predicted RNase H-like nuclease (RuvC/YqgF family)
MKSILYIVAILLTCGAAFFSFQHKNKFEALEADRIATIATNEDISSQADVIENNIKEERSKLAAAEERRDLLAQSVSSLEDKGRGLESDSKKLDGDIDAQKTEFAQLEKTLEELNKILAETGGGVTLDNLPDKIAEVNQDRDDKQKKLDELEGLVGSAEKVLASNRSELDRLGKRMIQRSSRISRNAMQAVVTAVNQDWGFLVIGAGSNSGFTPQTSLIVERNGRKIGRVRPSSIEPTQTIAEIDFDSIASGVRIQPGDRVILAKPSSN